MNGRAVASARPGTLSALLRARAGAAPRHPAMVTPGRSLCYAELDEEVDRFAAGLVGLGVRPGGTVALYGANVAESYIALLAATRIGAVFAPLQTKWKGRELARALPLASAAVLVVAPPAGDGTYQRRLAEVGAAGGRLADHVVGTEGANGEGFIDYGSVLTLGGDGGARERARRWEAEVTPDRAAMIVFTSGTTGFPKAAVLAHGPTVRMGRAIADRFALTPDDRYHACSPISHLGGTTFSFVSTLAAGGTFLPRPEFDAAASLRWLRDQRCTVQHGIDSHWVMEMNVLDRAGIEAPRLRLANVSGLPPVLERVQRVFRPDHIMSGYGTTETGGAPVLTGTGDPVDKCLYSSGRPLEGIELRLVDADSGEPVPAGAEGEIRIRGWSQFAGYRSRPDETAAQFDESGWSKTGDLGRLDEDGYLHFLGRIRHVFRTGGENYAPEEVEAVLRSHGDVDRAVVIPVADEVLGQVGSAYVVIRDGARFDPDALGAYCRERLASYKVPRFIRSVPVDDLPLTASGKVQRLAAPPAVLTGDETHHRGYLPPFRQGVSIRDPAGRTGSIPQVLTL